MERQLRHMLAQIQHGSVTLIVQDGRVIQIDATHKLRLDRQPTGSHAADRGR